MPELSSSGDFNGSKPGEIIISQHINDKKDMLTLEAYLTAGCVYSEKREPAPCDIVLILDRSGSMKDRYGRQNTRLDALNKAVNGLLDCIGEAFSERADHKISIITFSSTADTLAGWTYADASGIASIKDKLSKPGKLSGGSCIGSALSKAQSLISERSETVYSLNGVEKERRLLVVLFSDGYPGAVRAGGDCFTSSHGIAAEADSAVNAAAKLKEMGALVYTVGAFDGADPAASYLTDMKSGLRTVWRNAAKCANGLMHFISSDYDAGCTSWQDFTCNNDGRNNGCYMAADNTDALIRAFNNITYETVLDSNVIYPDGSYLLKSVISDYFTVSGKVGVYTAAYDSHADTFAEEIPFEAELSISGNNISVSGFDFARYACSGGSKNGQKLIVKIPIKDTVKDFGFYPVSEDCSGLYNADGEIVTFAPLCSASVTNLIDLSSNRTSLPDFEKRFAKIFGKSAYFRNQWPTMSSLRKIGDNIYLLDYQYEYDIDDLMERGVSSAAKLLSYASRHIFCGVFKFREGPFGVGCSAYEAHNEDGDHILGRNFDYMDAPCYVVWTHPSDAYASISMVDANFLLTFDKLKPHSTLGRFQSMLAPYFCLDGMNETGFAISVLQIHADGTRQDTGKTAMFTTAMIRCCLDKCASVSEAIELFRQFDIQDTVAFGYSLGCCFHYMLSDAAGDAAVIEYVNGEMRVIRAGDKGFDELFVTNYYLAEDGGVGMEAYDPEGMERYDIIANALTENKGVLSFHRSFDLLSDVHLNYRHNNNLYNITTLWSCLYNNTRCTMSLAARMDYSKIYTFDVKHPLRVFEINSVDVRVTADSTSHLR